MLNPGSASGCKKSSHLEVINVFSVFKRFASNLGGKRAEWKNETEDWVGNGKRPECILVPDLFGYMVRAFRKNMDMGQAKQQHSPS
jgi:hypothetical protein